MRLYGSSGGTAAYHAIMAWSGSIVMHVLLASTGALIAASAPDDAPLGFRHVVTRSQAPRTMSVELPSLSSRDVAAWLGRSPIEPQAELGGERMARPDSGRLGRGGDDQASQPAINLASRDDAAHLTPMIRSRLERAQHARHREGEGRRSPEDDTVSERPMIATIFVTGSGTRYEQRPFAAFDPGAGAHGGGVRVVRGGARRVGRPAGIGLAAEHDAPLGNGSYDAIGGGTLDSWWHADGYAANVMNLRPFSVRGRTASSADERGDHADTVDAEQEDMTLEQSWFHASTAGGPRGVGVGGEKGPGPTGSGGEVGPGSRSRAMGTGDGPGSAIHPADRRRRMYLRRVRAKIHASWSVRDFPKHAVLDGKNGVTIVSFTIHKNGTVSGVRTARNSGFPGFDAKMRAAVLRAAPFGPLPADLGGSLRTSHPFRVDNPAVR